jgi:hypothetical protein
MSSMTAAALLLAWGVPGGAQEWSDEALQSVRKLRVAPGLKAELFAAEPQFVNPVCFSIDEKGRFFVAETHRRHSSVFEVWDRRDWLDGDLASRRVEDREALYRKHLGASADQLSAHSERIRILEDLGGKGRADFAATFAEGFNALADGLGSSVLARGDEVWYTCAPNLWHLRVGADGKSSARKVLHYGFGVHMGSGAHDLHGLSFGPDGKIYFSMGDRGFHVTAGGRTFDSPCCAAIRTARTWRSSRRGSGIPSSSASTPWGISGPATTTATRATRRAGSGSSRAATAAGASATSARF